MKKYGVKKKKRSNRSLIVNIFIFTGLGLVGVFMILPIVYAVINAFKPLDELYLFPPRFFVRRPTMMNFTVLFKLSSNLWVPFSRYMFNSIFVTVVATAGHVILASMAAYPLAKYKLRLGWVFNIVVMALLLNTTVLWIPQYVIMSKMGIINTYLAYILPCIPAPIGLFLMKQFMEQIPFSLIEAAMLEGEKQWGIFWKIVMPQVKPAWLTLTLFAFQVVWNQQPYGVVFDEQLKLINGAIEQIINGGISRHGVSMAGSVFMMIPPIIVFIMTQDKVVETMAHSGIKG